MDGTIDRIGACCGSTHALPLPWLCLSLLFSPLPYINLLIWFHSHTHISLFLHTIAYINVCSSKNELLGNRCYVC
ncbi:hypothetical protein I3843_07G122800 [Carya illinoinensis]|nr:hypothetical protein I3843_07G122800 [Carya illinoinensis]